MSIYCCGVPLINPPNSLVRSIFSHCLYLEKRHRPQTQIAQLWCRKDQKKAIYNNSQSTIRTKTVANKQCTTTQETACLYLAAKRCHNDLVRKAIVCTARVATNLPPPGWGMYWGTPICEAHRCVPQESLRSLPTQVQNVAATKTNASRHPPNARNSRPPSWLLVPIPIACRSAKCKYRYLSIPLLGSKHLFLFV